MAHNFIHNRSGIILQQPLAHATAGYILPTAKLEVEKPHLIQDYPDIKPLDMSFDVDPMHSADTPATCPFDTSGWDFTITPTVSPSPVSGSSANVKEIVTAAAEQHL